MRVSTPLSKIIRPKKRKWSAWATCGMGRKAASKPLWITTACGTRHLPLHVLADADVEIGEAADTPTVEQAYAAAAASGRPGDERQAMDPAERPARAQPRPQVPHAPAVPDDQVAPAKRRPPLGRRRMPENVEVAGRVEAGRGRRVRDEAHFVARPAVARERLAFSKPPSRGKYQ